MSKTVNTKEYLSLTLSLLHEGHSNVPVTVSGTSMVPFLRPGDTVYLNLPERPYRVGDVVLFTRPGGSYVLHRIVGKKDGCFMLLGDGQITQEPVPFSHVHAVMTSARVRDRIVTPRHPRWLFYSTLWRWMIPLRPLIGKWKKKSR